MAKGKNPVLMLSDRLYLTPCREDHADKFCQWLNDPEVYGHLRDMSEVFRVEEVKLWISQIGPDPSQEVFALYYLPEDQLIGNGGFKHLNHQDKTGEIWIVLGEKNYWRQGLGTEARWLICKYGFEKLGLKNILGEHYEINPVSLHNAKKTGAKPMGTRRKSKWTGEKYVDVHYTDMLPEDLVKPEKK